MKPAVFFAFLWWALTAGSTVQLWLGAIVVMTATVSYLRLPRFGRATRLVLGTALFRFAVYFVVHSLTGAVLLTWFALMPQRRIKSEYFDFEVKIPRDAMTARLFFASCLCVFPGTLSCGYRGDTLVVHALDVRFVDQDAVRELEQIVTSIFNSSA